jgi:pimeloyl-ACP methyl ester carboxylesterase
MKKVALVAFLLLPVLTLILASPVPAHSEVTWPPICQENSLASGDPKYPVDQLIVICIPPSWNGHLIIYAHGYVPPQAPLALPADELTLPDGTFAPNVFLAQGFAFATTSFHKNGAAVEQGATDINRLLDYFKSVVSAHSLKKVFIAGASEGGLIVLSLLERYPRNYDAGLALCAPAGGSLKLIRSTYDFRVVFDYFFPNVFTFPPNLPGEAPFGAVDVPQNAFWFWESAYVPRIVAALTNDPLAAAQLFNVTKAATDPADPTSAINTALSLLFYSIFGTNDQIATADGIPYGNRFTIYTGSSNDAALNAGVERIGADLRALLYALRFYRPNGNLQDPLVMMHNTRDEVVSFRHVISYSLLVALKHKSSSLSVLPVPRYGHCNFTGNEIFQAFALMLQKAGIQPVN